VVRRNTAQWETVLHVARAGVNSPLTSSAGRLFDAVAAILGVRDTIHYEGQAAVELEQLADRTVHTGYTARLTGAGPFTVDGADLVRAVVDDLASGTPVPTVAGRFHIGVAQAIVAGAERVRAGTGLGTVALSGGVFQNLLLLDSTEDLLTSRGFRVLTHHRVPTNDGGLSLGQAAVACASDAL
jgi:hydrogenase maturation protein HypF